MMLLDYSTGPHGCCNSCFSPGGCAAPCKNNKPPSPPSPPTPPGPPPPPPPPPAPAPPVPTADLAGTYEGANGKAFTLTVDATTHQVSIANPADPSSCWTSGAGNVTANGSILAVLAQGASCVRQAYGTVSVKSSLMVVDVDYPYYVDTVTIIWKVCIEPDNEVTCEHGSWPSWSKTLPPRISYPTLHEEL